MGPIIIPRLLPNKANTKLRAVTKASIPREAILRIFILKLEAFHRSLYKQLNYLHITSFV